MTRSHNTTIWEIPKIIKKISTKGKKEKKAKTTRKGDTNSRDSSLVTYTWFVCVSCRTCLYFETFDDSLHSHLICWFVQVFPECFFMSVHHDSKLKTRNGLSPSSSLSFICLNFPFSVSGCSSSFLPSGKPCLELAYWISFFAVADHFNSGPLKIRHWSQINELQLILTKSLARE